jgi:hypothetical protein
MPEYTCECCNFKTLIKTKFAEHCETTKHKRNIENPVEISLSEQVAVLKNKVVSLELMNKQQSIQMGEFEQQMKDMNLKMELFSMLMVKSVQVQPAVQPVIQPVVQPVIQPVIQHVIQPEDHPERWNEKYLNDNFKTSINELLNQVIFDEDEVADLLENPHNLNKLVLKTLKKTVENTDISHRGLVTADTSRKKMWIKKNKDNWEVDPKATFYIKNKLQNEIIDILEKMVKNERGDFVAGAETYTDLLVTTSQSTNKWETIDTKIMQMFVVDS